MKASIVLALVIAILSAAIWFLVGPMAVSVFGEHRERESQIELWEKTETFNTRLGDIVGLQKETANGRVLAFLGIRYAEPPTGAQRFS